jgi:large subunit ribosomal protein L30
VAKKKSAPKQLEITQVRSGIGRPGKHRRTLEALGLKRHQQSVIQTDTPAIRGMIAKVTHLVSVRELDEE